MTQKIYHTDSYARECEAGIVKAGGKSVTLDKTIFYPQSGGQPADTGKIIAESGEYNVVFGKQFGEDVSYEVENGGLRTGDKVKIIVDWERRYRHMRMHTSAHLLAACIMKETGALITGNQLSETQSRMDFNVKEFDRTLLKTFEEKVNEKIQQDLPVTVSFMKREEAMQNPALFRLKDILPKNIPMLRIVSIGGFDIQADGGTHVKSTGEIGKFRITEFKNKGAENRRIYWRVE